MSSSVPRCLRGVLEGRPAILVKDGQLDKRALQRESLTREELVEVIHRQGFEDFHEVRRCELEPNGTFYVEAFNPSTDDKRHSELLTRLDALSREVAARWVHNPRAVNRSRIRRLALPEQWNRSLRSLRLYLPHPISDRSAFVSAVLAIGSMACAQTLEQRPATQAPPPTDKPVPGLCRFPHLFAGIGLQVETNRNYPMRAGRGRQVVRASDHAGGRLAVPAIQILAGRSRNLLLSRIQNPLARSLARTLYSLPQSSGHIQPVDPAHFIPLMVKAAPARSDRARLVSFHARSEAKTILSRTRMGTGQGSGA